VNTLRLKRTQLDKRAWFMETRKQQQRSTRPTQIKTELKHNTKIETRNKHNTEKADNSCDC